MKKTTVEKGWLSLADAAKYVGLSSTVLRQAIAKGNLPAYEKPATYRSKGIRTFVKISLSDLDAWVRTWEPVTFGGQPRTR